MRMLLAVPCSRDPGTDKLVIEKWDENSFVFTAHNGSEDCSVKVCRANLAIIRNTLSQHCPVLPSTPVEMLLWCPQCGERHIDAGEFATNHHHTHACQECGHVWRPAILATVGVKFLPGFKDGV